LHENFESKQKNQRFYETKAEKINKFQSDLGNLFKNCQNPQVAISNANALWGRDTLIVQVKNSNCHGTKPLLKKPNVKFI